MKIPRIIETKIRRNMYNNETEVIKDAQRRGLELKDNDLVEIGDLFLKFTPELALPVYRYAKNPHFTDIPFGQDKYWHLMWRIGAYVHALVKAYGELGRKFTKEQFLQIGQAFSQERYRKMGKLEVDLNILLAFELAQRPDLLAECKQRLAVRFCESDHLEFMVSLLEKDYKPRLKELMQTIGYTI